VQQRAALVTRALLVAIPLSGGLYSSATGVQGGSLRSVRIRLNFTLLALVCIHGVVALEHHFVDRNAALNQMLPRSWNLGGSLGVP
jgi:hypothetical protein